MDVIDKENVIVDQQMKSTIHAHGLRHRVSAILLQDKLGKFFLPKASSLKVEAGGLFHSAAGHVASGETYETAAKRELWEELSLEAGIGEFQDMGFFLVGKRIPNKNRAGAV